MKNSTQVGIIAFSVALLSGSLFLGIDYANKITPTDVFNIDSEAVESITAPLTYETRIAKGDSLYASNYYTLAATEYAFAVLIQEENPEAFDRLGNTYLKMNETAKAVDNYKTAWDLAPSNTDYKINYGKALIKNKNFDEAETVFENPSEDNQRYLYFAAILDAYYGNHAQAKSRFEKASLLEGIVPSSYIQEFLTTYANFDAQQEGQDVYLRATLANSFIEVEEFQLAEALSLTLLNEQNDYRDVWILLGYAQLQMEQYQEAEDAFKQAKTLDSIKPETHYFLGTAYYLQEEYDEAVKEFELALLYNFEPATEAYRKMAESNLFLENYDDALAAYEFLIKVDANDINIFVRPIWIAIDILHDLDRALTLAEESVTEFPEEAMSHNLLAWVYIERNELEKASTEIDTAFAIDPNLAEAHYNAGLLHLKEEDLEGAKLEFKEAYEKSQSGDGINEKASEQYNILLNPTEE